MFEKGIFSWSYVRQLLIEELDYKSATYTAMGVLRTTCDANS